jgi:hypothetical protein
MSGPSSRDGGVLWSKLGRVITGDMNVKLMKSILESLSNFEFRLEIGETEPEIETELAIES